MIFIILTFIVLGLIDTLALIFLDKTSMVSWFLLNMLRKRYLVISYDVVC